MHVGRRVRWRAQGAGARAASLGCVGRARASARTHTMTTITVRVPKSTSYRQTRRAAASDAHAPEVAKTSDNESRPDSGSHPSAARRILPEPMIRQRKPAARERAASRKRAMETRSDAPAANKKPRRLASAHATRALLASRFRAASLRLLCRFSSLRRVTFQPRAPRGILPAAFRSGIAGCFRNRADVPMESNRMQRERIPPREKIIVLVLASRLRDDRARLAERLIGERAKHPRRARGVVLSRPPRRCSTCRDIARRTRPGSHFPMPRAIFMRDCTGNIAPFRVVLRRTVRAHPALRLIASIIHGGGGAERVAECSVGAVRARRGGFRAITTLLALLPFLLVVFSSSRSAVSPKKGRTRRAAGEPLVHRCNEISAYLFAYIKSRHDLVQLSGETVVKSKPSSLNRVCARHRGLVKPML